MWNESQQVLGSTVNVLRCLGPPKAQALSLLGEHPAPSSAVLRLARSGSPFGLEVDGEGWVSLVTVLLSVPLSQGRGASLLMESEDTCLPLRDGS